MTIEKPHYVEIEHGITYKHINDVDYKIKLIENKESIKEYWYDESSYGDKFITISFMITIEVKHVREFEWVFCKAFKTINLARKYIDSFNGLSRSEYM